MRSYAKLPPNLWEDLYLTATHLHIRTLARSNDKTPFEKWHERKPDYLYMREIGSDVYVLILNRHNPKIYERSIKCVLVGYEMQSKSYLCWSREDKQMYTSYHVRFIESHQLPVSLSPPVVENPLLPLQEPTVADIFQNASLAPIPFANDDLETLPIDQPFDGDHDHAGQVLEVPEQLPDVPANPVPDQNPLPRRSSRVPKPKDIFKAARLNKAVQESKESAERVAAVRAAKRKTLQDIRDDEEHNDPKVVEQAGIDELCSLFHDKLAIDDNLSESERANILLSVIAACSNIDQKDMNFDDDPNTWEQARASIYADK
jgi:hypothetical protein